MPSERQSLLPQASPSLVGRGSFMQRSGPVVGIGILMIACSAGLINYNKYLLGKDRFPFAMVLVICHTVFCSACAAVLLLVCPSLFPSLTDPLKKVDVSPLYICKSVLPVALFFCAQLVFSNTAYLYTSVGFLQMMKQANVVLVYVFSLACALEVWRWRQAQVLSLVVMATLITVKGELAFSWTGFVIQGLSCLAESCKIIMQGIVLSGSGRKLDPLSYVLIVSPLCAIFLCGVLVANLASGSALVAVPHLSDFVACRWLLAGNVVVAFALNVVIALFIKVSSALSFVLVNIVKDAVIVLASAMLLGEQVSLLQTFGFTMQLLLVALWSLMKSFPDQFEDGFISGLRAVTSGDHQK